MGDGEVVGDVSRGWEGVEVREMCGGVRVVGDGEWGRY